MAVVNMLWALFEEMRLLGLKPDEVTFVALLCACGHSGLGLKLIKILLFIVMSRL